MFRVEGDKITITKGDTAALTIRATNQTFATADRAIFTIANKGGTTKLFEKEYELNDGAFTVEFLNGSGAEPTLGQPYTDTWTPGQYKWQVRYVVSPTRGSQEAINGGTKVLTPWEPKDFVVQNVLADF